MNKDNELTSECCECGAGRGRLVTPELCDEDEFAICMTCADGVNVIYNAKGQVLDGHDYREDNKDLQPVSLPVFAFPEETA